MVPGGGMVGDRSRRMSLGLVPPGLGAEVTTMPWPCSPLCRHVCKGRDVGTESCWLCQRPACGDLRH